MYYGPDMMDGYGNASPWYWVFMALMMLVFVLIAVLVIRYLVREWHKSRHIESPLDVLKRRYANGEIDKKEYQEKLKDLKD